MRTNCKHYGSEARTAKHAVKAKHSEVSCNTVEKKHSRKAIKALSFITTAVLVTAVLVIPTTTLAPGADAFEDSRALSYAVGNIDDFSSVITENCVPVTTAPQTEKPTVAQTTASESSKKAESNETTTAVAVIKETKNEPVDKNEVKQTEPIENVVESKNNGNENSSSSIEETVEISSDEASGVYLIDIQNPDLSYSPSMVVLSDYDRAKLERLVMGEAGSMGFNGCALVAQAIRDAMNRSNTSSIDAIISEYQYYAPTNKQPNQNAKDAVSYIFDQNGSAVQHRVLCFYTGSSAWHETQEFIVSCGSVRFFDLKV